MARLATGDHVDLKWQSPEDSFIDIDTMKNELMAIPREDGAIKNTFIIPLSQLPLPSQRTLQTAPAHLDQSFFRSTNMASLSSASSPLHFYHILASLKSFFRILSNAFL